MKTLSAKITTDFNIESKKRSQAASNDRLREIIAERILHGFGSFRFEEFQQDIEDFAAGSNDALTKDQMKKQIIQIFGL